MELLARLKANIRLNKFMLFFIAVLTVEYVFQDKLPGGSVLGALLLVVYLEKYINYASQRFSAVYLLKALLCIGLYFFYIHTYYAYLQNAVMLLCGLWLSCLLLKYLQPKNNITDDIDHLVQRMQQLILALLTALLVFLSAEVLIYLFTMLFSFRQFDLRSWTEGICYGIFLFVIIQFKYRKYHQAGYVYRLLFNIILPYLSIITGLFGMAYLIKSMLGYSEIINFSSHYYPYILMFYLFYLLSLKGTTGAKLKRTNLLLFIALTVITMVYTVIRKYSYPDYGYNIFYPLVFNGVFLIYNLYLYLNRKEFSKILWYITAALIVLFYAPVCGYLGYLQTLTYESGKKIYSVSEKMQKPLEHNVYERYLLEKDDKIAAVKERNSFFFADNHRIDSRGFSTVITGINLYRNSDKEEVAGLGLKLQDNSLNIKYNNETARLPIQPLHDGEATQYLKVPLKYGEVLIYEIDYDDNNEITSISFHILFK